MAANPQEARPEVCASVISRAPVMDRLARAITFSVWERLDFCGSHAAAEKLLVQPYGQNLELGQWRRKESAMSKLEVLYRPVVDLSTNPSNARRHSKKQIDKIAASIRSFGFNVPLLVDDRGQLIAGHGRLAAAQRLGLAEVPTIEITGLSDAQVRAFAIADNRIAELSDWDEAILAAEFEELLKLGEGLDFEIVDTGFEIGKIDQLVSSAKEPQPEVEEVLEPDAVPRVARLGDLWQCGRHQIFCGDARDPDSYRLLMGAERADMVISDPPYNVPINGHVSGLGKTKHREFVMAAGEMSDREFDNFLEAACIPMRDYSRDGALIYLFMDWRHIAGLIAMGSRVFTEFKALCVWNKLKGSMGSLYRSQHELIAVFKKGTAPHINNVELGKHGRTRTNVWDSPGMASFGHGRDEALKMHSTVKPIQLIADAIMDCTRSGDIVLDPFGGSGTAALSAERTGRTARLIELDPGYVDVTLARFHRKTGSRPVNLWTGELFPVLDSGSKVAAS
jgi:DNA modification methylase